MTIMHFKVVLAAIFIIINIQNRKIRPYSQFYSLITSKCVPLMSEIIQILQLHSIPFKVLPKFKIATMHELHKRILAQKLKN